MGDLFRKILGAPSALLRGLAEKLVISKLRGIIEGPPGALRSALLWVQGGKTYLGLALGFLAYVANYLGASGGYVVSLGSVSAVLIGVGLADKGLQQPGRPAAVASAGWYLILAENAGTIATALTAAFAYVAGPSCVAWEIKSLSLTCAGQANILLFLALALVYLGVLDAGFLSTRPKRG